jgi:hypothetical protein
LNKAGFDVFLDTRSVPYGIDFQSVLWHRMADSDVVVLLDTPSFRQSHWTVQELSRANTTNIQILHLLWPKVNPDESSAFSEFVSLSSSNFRGRDKTGPRARLTDAAAELIVTKTESLRARALAARHRGLVDNFCDQAKGERARFVAVQPQRFISLKLEEGKRIAVVPTIGIPRADRYHELEQSIRNVDNTVDQVWLLYDERGILETWISHLDWLNAHLPATSVQVSNCSALLRGTSL